MGGPQIVSPGCGFATITRLLLDLAVIVVTLYREPGSSGERR